MPKLHPELASSIRAGGQLRQDLITGKWVIVAPARAKRPAKDNEVRPKSAVPPKYVSTCPFCNLADFPQQPDRMRLPDSAANWQVHLFENKYPALSPKSEYKVWQQGLQRTVEAVGFHELLVTRWHDQEEYRVPLSVLGLELEALVLRYRQLQHEPAVNYIQIIRNHGEASGASIAHPHHQIFTTPIVPNDVRDLLEGAERYQAQNGREVFADLIREEVSVGSRLVTENRDFVAFCPFSSQSAYETWIVPKESQPYFSNIAPAQRASLAEILQDVLKRLHVTLNDPPFNYIIYSAPCGERPDACRAESFDHFRWHIQIRPRLDRLGGFELATGLEIISVMPEDAAEQLRGCRL